MPKRGSGPRPPLIRESVVHLPPPVTARLALLERDASARELRVMIAEAGASVRDVAEWISLSVTATESETAPIPDEREVARLRRLLRRTKRELSQVALPLLRTAGPWSVRVRRGTPLLPGVSADEEFADLPRRIGDLESALGALSLRAYKRPRGGQVGRDKQVARLLDLMFQRTAKAARARRTRRLDLVSGLVNFIFFPDKPTSHTDETAALQRTLQRLYPTARPPRKRRKR